MPIRTPLGLFLFVSIVLSELGLALAWCIPDLPEVSGRAHPATWAAFFARAFWWHAASAVALAGLVAFLLRFRRAALASLPCLALAAFGVLRPGHHASPDPGPPTLTLLSANLLVHNHDPTGLLAEIDRVDPDILLFVEYTRAKHERLLPDLRDRYPFFASAMRHDRYGMAIFSRFEIVGEPETHPHRHAIPLDARAHGVVALADAQLRIVVRAPTRAGASRDVVIQGIHAMPPTLPSHLGEQRALFRWLARWASTEDRPLIVAGDFNASPAAQSEQWLRDAGLRDAHVDAGRGRGATWPEVRFGLVPGLRIDQVRVRGPIRAVRTEVGRDIDSDHRPVVARFAID